MTDKIKISILLTFIFLFLCYSFLLYKRSYEAGTAPASLADQGKKLWQEKNCNACHQVYGLGGYLGPDLTNIYSSRSEAHIKAFLQAGTNIMPAFALKDKEVEQIMAYLKSVDATGVAAPSKLKINYDGTIER